MANNKNEFQRIWWDVVCPLIKEFETSSELKYNSFLLQKRMEYFYNKYSSVFLNSYMSKETEKIDRHKIAACFLKSILVCKPFRIPVLTKLRILFKKCDISESMMFTNQHLALSVAVTIMDGYISADENKELKHAIILPEPFPKEDIDYLRDICIDLYYTNSKKINTITYANVFFLLEKYSCRKVQCDYLEKKVIELLKEKQLYSNDTILEIVKSIRFGKE